MRFPPLPNNYNAAAEKHLYFSHSAFIAGGGNVVDGSKEGYEKANSVVRRKPRTFYDPNWRPIVHQFLHGDIGPAQGGPNDGKRIDENIAVRKCQKPGSVLFAIKPGDRRNIILKDLQTIQSLHYSNYLFMQGDFPHAGVTYPHVPPFSDSTKEPGFTHWHPEFHMYLLSHLHPYAEKQLDLEANLNHILQPEHLEILKAKELIKVIKDIERWHSKALQCALKCGRRNKGPLDCLQKMAKETIQQVMASQQEEEEGAQEAPQQNIEAVTTILTATAAGRPKRRKNAVATTAATTTTTGAKNSGVGQKKTQEGCIILYC